MALFDLPADEELTPQVRQMLEEYCRIVGTETVSTLWRAYGRSPGIIEARFRAFQNLSAQCRFSRETKNVAIMLIAHAKGCQACFAGSRFQLDRLGFDEATLDGMCAHPEALPLQERDRLFVHYVLKFATASADLRPKDFREMAAHGFSRDEIQEMIAFAAYWTMNIVFSQAATAALSEE